MDLDTGVTGIENDDEDDKAGLTDDDVLGGPMSHDV